MTEHRQMESPNDTSSIADEPVVTVELARTHGLTDNEYDRIVNILGRLPTYAELGVFSVMWSEHCSYKNSLVLLRTLPRRGKGTLADAGAENAGIIDIGGGLAVVFKVESHNHPSAVEPYQGAATGVGGIMRDVFTMGARPIACLDSLRFGPPDSDRTRYLFDGVIRGIADYGNSFGVPTVAGEIYFHPSYTENPLINVMAVGIVRHDRVISAAAKGVGNAVMLVGSSTGRDGIHGATFASAELNEESEKKRPSVQVGDPFAEKLLLEAFLEAIKTGFVVAAQDMGAAGFTSTSSEMAARAKVGIEVNLDLVPVREQGMSAYEILLSESQERMLLVVKAGRERDVENVFGKWDLNAVVVGRVTAEQRLRIHYRGRTEVDIPPSALAAGEGAPVYVREITERKVKESTRSWDEIPEPADYGKTLLALLSLPDIASKRFVYEQYDTMVRTDTVVQTGKGDAAVLRIKGTKKALAVTIDGNARFVNADPRAGAALAVVEAFRNIISTGAEPLGITDCLNFGNPLDTEVYSQFAESIRGIADACTGLGLPVTGGNVSFYNESNGEAIIPSPVIGMVGLVDDMSWIETAPLPSAGDDLFVTGSWYDNLCDNSWVNSLGERGLPSPIVPGFDGLLRSKNLVLRALKGGLVAACHDISDGGLAVALAEIAINADLGASVSLRAFPGRLKPHSILFSEPQANFLLLVPPPARSSIEALASSEGVPLLHIGTLQPEVLEVSGLLRLPVSLLRRIYLFSLEKLLAHP